MPELDITIGGRSFQVACRDGEEDYLYAAAALLDAEAQPLADQLGRMPEARLLLMAGLMLADRMAGVTEQLRQAQARIAELEARPEPPSAPVEVQVEIPVVPPALVSRLAALARDAEATAKSLERQADTPGAD